MRYVLGFAFTADLSHVVLLRKDRGPEMNRGKLNGLGGKIEPGETVYEAMQREFKEEAGVEISTWSWKGRFKGEGWVVEVFSARTDQAFQARTQESEEVAIVPLEELGSLPLCAHVSRLIDLCLAEDIRYFSWEERATPSRSEQ